MNSSFLKFTNIIFISMIFLALFIAVIFVPILSSNISFSFDENHNYNEISLNSNDLLWPLPGFTKVSSPFGKRKAPAGGSSTNHSGIDIPAPSGTNIVSICDGKVIYIGFKGAGGYTLTIQNKNLEISYCHVSPKYIVSVGTIVKKSEHISNVGPYNVYDVPNNPYKDNNGNPTNGASTGCHLHLGIKKDGYAVNPLDFF